MISGVSGSGGGGGGGGVGSRRVISISSSAKTSCTSTFSSSLDVFVDHSKAKKRSDIPSTNPIRIYVPLCTSKFAFGDFFTSSLSILNNFYLLLVCSNLLLMQK